MNPEVVKLLQKDPQHSRNLVSEAPLYKEDGSIDLLFCQAEKTHAHKPLSPLRNAFTCPNPLGLPAPQKGDTLYLWDDGVGTRVRGCATDNHIYFYRMTEEDERTIQKKAEFKEGLVEFMGEIRKLPPSFQDRFQGFMNRNPNWGWEFGPYELHVCKTACEAIGYVLNELGQNPSTEDANEALRQLYQLSYDQQLAILPSIEGANGNRANMAFRLASIYFISPDIIPKAHGALCPLVGCEKYGCWASTQKNGEEPLPEA